jgi:phage-related protein
LGSAITGVENKLADSSTGLGAIGGDLAAVKTTLGDASSGLVQAVDGVKEASASGSNAATGAIRPNLSFYMLPIIQNCAISIANGGSPTVIINGSTNVASALKTLYKQSAYTINGAGVLQFESAVFALLNQLALQKSSPSVIFDKDPAKAAVRAKYGTNANDVIAAAELLTTSGGYNVY